MKKIPRICIYCGTRKPYRDLPEGTVCFQGMTACGDCIERGDAEEFLDVVEAHERIHIDDLTGADSQHII